MQQEIHQYIMMLQMQHFMQQHLFINRFCHAFRHNQNRAHHAAEKRRFDSLADTHAFLCGKVIFFRRFSDFLP